MTLNQPTLRPFRTRCLMAITFLLAALGAEAQELISPLHAIPRPGNQASMLKSAGSNDFFVYDNAGQTLPVIDDFSVDRTRHLNANATDANVTHVETWYKIIVNGDSTPDMAFLTDTSYHFLVDQQPDTLIITVTPNPAQVAIIRDLSVYPVTEQSIYVWPPYTLLDSTSSTSTDTLPLDANLLQDSLRIFSVAQDPRSYINPDNSLRPWTLWADDDAYINNTFALNPPTIGVATFDGMDRTGYPYNPTSPNVNGLADKLTSVPINLSYPPGDSIYLSFLYEAIGLSGNNNLSELHNDSLRLELYAPDENHWYQVWSTPQAPPIDSFQQVMVPITDPKFLKSTFKMRFSNDATLGGAVDQWHLDYVRLDRNRTAADTILQDVAYVYGEAGLLQTYSSVPFAKFVETPAFYMAQQLDLDQRNNDTQDKFITWGYDVSSDCGWTASRDNYGNNISSNASSTFNTVHPVNSGTDPLVYDVSGCTDAAFLTAKFWTNATPDVCAYNDTMTTVQELSNYYSYDDGTAEAGYSLNAAGAKQAYRFDTQGADSLRALRMYFDPIFTYDPPPVNDPPAGSFILTVWSSLTPEHILFQNVSFSSPQYHTWGPNHFVEYPLDSTIAVSGTFYVGWVQTNDTRMYLGMDKNRDNHDKMFYKVGLNWAASAQQGSWMIRPVMVAAVDPFAGVEEVAPPEGSVSIYPNPVADAFHVAMGEGSAQAEQVELIDPMGRPVRRWNADENSLSVQDVANGLYIVRIIARDGNAVAQGRLIVQH